MPSPSPIQTRPDERHVVKIDSGDPAVLEVNVSEGSQRDLHYRTLRRIPSSASTRAGAVIELMSERSRINCMTMRSQF